MLVSFLKKICDTQCSTIFCNTDDDDDKTKIYKNIDKKNINNNNNDNYNN